MNYEWLCDYVIEFVCRGCLASGSNNEIVLGSEAQIPA